MLSAIVMIALATGAVIYVLAMPFVSGERKASKRLATVSRGKVAGPRGRGVEAVSTRKREVQDTLKELEEKQKSQNKRPSLRTRLLRAGLNVQPRSFYLFCLGLAAGVAFLILITGSPPIVCLMAGFVAGVGLPRWLLGYLARRRQLKFMHEFANAIDIIVRGVKSGLPLNDCLRIIAQEVSEPVKTEFVNLVDEIRVGVPLAKSFQRMYERMPLQEVNFFAITIAIQQQAGGNLAEALNNLSQVLRDRHKLEGKVRALSAEANTSAMIIGALPLVVMGAVYMTTPDYIALLWTKRLGQIMLAGSAIWMTMGVIVMRKMIKFDY